MRRGGLAVASLGALAAAAVCAAVVAARHAEATALSPIAIQGGWRSLLIGATAVAAASYALGLLRLRRSRAPLAAVLAVAAVVQLAPLGAPLLLSTDAYSYWAYARVARVHGANPYETPPSAFPRDPAYGRMGADWQRRTTVYGPGFTLLSETSARRGAHGAELLFRILAAVAMLCATALAAARAGRPVFAAAAVGWNPLLALHSAGGGHNDAVLAACAVAAVLLASRRRAQLAGAAWALALAVKATALVFLPLYALERRRQGSPLGLGGFALCAAALAAVASWAYASGWLRVFSPIANQLRASTSLGLPYWLAQVGVSERLARDALLVLLALGYAWLLREAWHGRARLGRAALLLVVTTSWLQPWYLAWSLPLAAAEDDEPALWGGVALSAYFLWDAVLR